MKIIKKFLKIHVLLFGMMSFFVFLSLREATPIDTITAKVLGERNPASVEKPLKSTEIVQINCDQDQKEISVSALQVRLEGPLCNNKNAEMVSVENMTTGKPATLFVKQKHYSTDYIQLKNGKNQITVKYTVNNKPQQFDVTLVQ